MLDMEKGNKMNSQQLIGLSQKYVMQTYRRLPLVFGSGSGMYLIDVEGKKYLDFVGGIATCALGHSHPKFVAAISSQVTKLMHTSNIYHIEEQIHCAKLLAEHSFGDKAFFCNSGAEANEAAIKLARKYGNTILGGKNEIITMKNSFHGRTLATITATGQEKFQQGFAPLPAGFVYANFNDITDLENKISAKTCAVMLEPIQAEGGINMPSEDYLKKVRELCDKHKILMLLDEVQTGMGRTGTLFAYEASGITPDIMTLAKALGAGFPVGAMIATDRVAAAFAPGDHASTFGGNALAMSACRATTEIIFSEKLLENCQRVGNYFFEKLLALKDKKGMIKDVRGKGLILGLELDIEVAEIVKRCYERGLIVGTAGTNVLRFVPPLIIKEKDVDAALNTLSSALE